ncbi:MAG: ribonuclease P protein component [Actinobacteria bacterium]|nr:ribonuclease P protein component [Actinomycetota bacterium]MBM3712305.1 ribonuclease P protein component [Actinomycetota bacterium]
MKFETLKRSLDFTNLIKFGKQIDNNGFKLIININDTSSNRVRLGYIISKKTGKAVMRNRVKRIIREIFISFNKNNNKSLDIIIIARKPIYNLSLHDLKERIYSCIKHYLN